MLEVAQRESFKTNEELLLYGAEFDADDELALWRNVLEYVGFESAQQVTAEQLVKPLDLLLLRDVRKLLQEQLQVAKRSHHIDIY